MNILFLRQIFEMFFSIQLNIVVAISNNRIIGKNNALPWHLPIDLKHFKNLTWGMPVIMGKNTYLSLTQPLKGRYNIVVSKSLENTNENIVVCGSVEEAVFFVENTLHCKEMFVIGGGKLYASVMDKVDNIYITRIDTNCVGDIFFPTFEHKNWTLQHQKKHKADTHNSYDCVFEHWKK